MTGLVIIGLWAVGAVFGWALVAGATRGEPDDDGTVESLDGVPVPLGPDAMVWLGEPAPRDEWDRHVTEALRMVDGQ